MPTATVPLEVEQRAWLEHVSSGLSVEAFERECERKEAVEVMQAAISQLDAEDRALIESIYFEDVPLKKLQPRSDGLWQKSRSGRFGFGIVYIE